jgi:O-antigen ligase
MPEPGVGGVSDRRGDLIAVAAGAVAAAVIRHGAYDPVDAVLFPGVIAAVAVATRCRIEPRWRPALLFLAALAAWWLVAAVGWGRAADALPLFGCFAGFAASAVLVANLSPGHVRQLRTLLVLGASAFAVAGLVGLALRDYPLVMEAQGLWRLSGTLTYANAAGLLLAMSLPFALAAREMARRWAGPALTLIWAALLATMSRGAALALLAAAPLLVGLVRRAWWPLLLGTGAGAVAIATGSLDDPQPVVLGAAAAAAAAALLQPRVLVVAMACIAVSGGILAVSTTRDGIADAVDRRLSITELDDRTPEWRAAAREWWDAPLVGKGPERPFVSYHPGRTELVRYAHSEPLQVLMSSGLVGFVLLASAMVHLYRLCAGDGTDRVARAGLIIFAVGGVVDFSWHLPALGMIAGACAALASRLEVAP